MTNGSPDDSQTPPSQPTDEAGADASQRPRQSAPRQTSGAPGGGDSPRPDASASLFDRGLELLKVLFQRSFEHGIAIGYLVFFGIWTLGSGVIAGGLFAGLFAAGIFSSPEPELAVPTMIAIFGGAALAVTILMIVWQCLLVGLHRPIHRTMVRGPNYYDSVGDILRAAIERFLPILGVNVVIGVVVYGSGAVAVGTGLASSGVLESMQFEPNPLVLAALTGGWLVVTLAIGFFLGPATYFVATREIGVFDALGRSVHFVLEHLVEFLAAWGIFILGSFAYSCVSTFGTLIPCLGPFIQMALNAAAGLIALLYWAGVYILFEEQSDPNMHIVW